MQLSKHNLISFANSLHLSKKGKVKYKSLCHGALCKTNGEAVHCALGELYVHFIGPLAKPVTKKELKILEESDIDELKIKNSFWSLAGKWLVLSEIDEGKAARDLADVAKFRKIQKGELKTALKSKFIAELASAIPEANDSVSGEDKKAKIKRAQIVQEKLIGIADAYLV